MKATFLSALILAFCLTSFGQDSKKLPKLSVDEIVSKHLASIGMPEAIAAAKTRVWAGTASISSKKGYVISLSGPAQAASEGSNMLFAMVFNSNQYPFEKIGYDGKSISFGLPNGQRTAYNEFIKAKPSIVKEGLFNGALSTNWLLLDIKGKKAKLEYGGSDKLGDVPVYKLKYSPRGDELSVVLYFDAATFHHLQTDYEYTVEPRIGTSSTDIQTQRDYYTFVERFGDFKKAGDLTLPFAYQIDVDVQRNRTTATSGAGPIFTGALTYTIIFKDVFFDQSIEPGVFKVS